MMREKIDLINVRVAGLSKLTLMQKAAGAELIMESMGMLLLEMVQRVELLERKVLDGAVIDGK